MDPSTRLNKLRQLLASLPEQTPHHYQRYTYLQSGERITSPIHWEPIRRTITEMLDGTTGKDLRIWHEGELDSERNQALHAMWECKRGITQIDLGGMLAESSLIEGILDFQRFTRPVVDAGLNYTERRYLLVRVTTLPQRHEEGGMKLLNVNIVFENEVGDDRTLTGSSLFTKDSISTIESTA